MKLTIAAIVAMLIICFSSMKASAVNYPNDGQIDFLQRQGLSIAESYDYRASSIAIVERYYDQLTTNRINSGMSADSGSFVKDLRRIVKGISGEHLTNDAHQRYELIKSIRPFTPSNTAGNMIQMAFNLMNQSDPTHGLTSAIGGIFEGNFSWRSFGF